jgi:hypothetical protein
MAQSHDGQPAPNDPLSQAATARRWVRTTVVASPIGWLLPLGLAPVCFVALGVLTPDNAVALGPATVIGVVVIITLYESLYVGLWQGRLPWTRTGPAVVLALLWAASLSVLAVALFAPLSFRLYNAGHLPVSSGIHDLPHGAGSWQTSWDFAIAYFWQACDALPAAGVTDTLDWDQPLQHGTRMGLMLVAFRGLVILPLLASFVGIWKSRRAPNEGSAA